MSMNYAVRKWLILVMLLGLPGKSFGASAIDSMKQYQGFGIVVRVFGTPAEALYRAMAGALKPQNEGAVLGRNQLFACKPNQCYIVIKGDEFIVKAPSQEKPGVAEFVTYVPLLEHAVELRLVWTEVAEAAQLRLNTMIRIYQGGALILNSSAQPAKPCLKVRSDIVPFDTACSFQLVEGFEGLLMQGGNDGYAVTSISYPNVDRILFSITGSEARAMYQWLESLQPSNTEIVSEKFSPDLDRLFYQDEVSCFRPTSTLVEKTYPYRCHFFLERTAAGSLGTSVPPSSLTFRPHFIQNIFDGGPLTLSSPSSHATLDLTPCLHWNDSKKDKLYPCLYKQTPDLAIDDYVPYPSYYPQGVAVGWGVQQDTEE
ncbi:MAG TPA: hypothetical protein VE954_30605 [Oligoflexus sp.]|uniref:hypothetical protein n=1 Tax=Oligoflexus sp. TaxID=1971216 RepID=UPI002D22E1C4|nr:hypothetical protein [Oligoflexus sp.]HYX37476.1 hypothetical protein [Oligoflexus sp.]